MFFKISRALHFQNITNSFFFKVDTICICMKLLNFIEACMHIWEPNGCKHNWLLIEEDNKSSQANILHGQQQIFPSWVSQKVMYFCVGSMLCHCSHCNYHTHDHLLLELYLCKSKPVHDQRRMHAIVQTDNSAPLMESLQYFIFLHSPFCRAEGLCQHAAIQVRKKNA